MIGQVVLERYVVEQLLGSGAMGTVYRGRHQRLNRQVAIKIMHDHLTHDPRLLERFRREGQAAGKLSHPNVVAVLDVGELPDGKPVMVMEYVDGRSLADAMTAKVPRAQMLRWLQQLLSGLDHAHSMGLVHRDLKPDNVILQDDGTNEVARIVDFGIAVLRASDGSFAGKLTDTGAMIGTPQYMAPEQARAEAVDHRADLYALGIVMYEMMAGKTPFDGSPMEIALAKIERDPPPVAERSPGTLVDPVLAAFMRKLLARAVEQRFATAHVALEILELYERDRMAAAAALGVIDVERALAVVSLPPTSPERLGLQGLLPPRKRDR